MITKMTIVMLTKVKTLGKMADERTPRANRTVELTLMLYIITIKIRALRATSV